MVTGKDKFKNISPVMFPEDLKTKQSFFSTVRLSFPKVRSIVYETLTLKSWP